ncbi:MAG TPA: PDZ domain-containing protein [Pirellulaceae bacterium]|nr:PDZ domain-containing protein [Pirellulaceae bacterium]
MTAAQATVRGGLLAAIGLLAPALLLAQQPAPATGKADQVPAAGKPRNPPSAEAIARWISDLDSDVFDNRENATVRLVEAGLPAIGPVKKVLQDTGSLEVTTRALHVLRELGLATDLDTQDAARLALEELARDPTSIGRRAATTIAWLNEQRSAQTIAALEKLGAIINKSPYLSELGVHDEVDGIQIDDSWQGTAGDYRRLKWLQNVDKLVLAGDKIDDSILPHVAAMPGLKRLHLFRTKVTERGLAAIGSLASLHEIGIYYTPLGDGAVAPLKGLKGLTSVRIYGTKISPAAKDELVAALELEPKKMDFRQGAFLGVSCQTLATRCELASVHPESPAEKAGLKGGDTLVTFAGKEVTDYDSLTAVISQYSLGDTVEVEYLRRTIDENGHDSGEQAMKCKVTLGGWDVELVQRQPPR